MAGKTFPGIGDLEDESPPLDPADAADSSGNAQFYSGPTVVDDVKVEQGLKKLRSLDAPPGPLTGIHQAVADVLGDPRITPQVTIPGTLMMPEFTIDPARGTAVGRSVSGPVVGQQTTQPFDDRALRGTMFGHGVHLPDLEQPSRPQEIETSKALAIVERGVPTTNEIAIFQPGPGYGQHAGIPLGHDAYPGLPGLPGLSRSNRSHARETPIDLQTVSPRKKLILRAVAAAACIGAIVVAALLWVHSTSEESETAARPTATLPAAPLPRSTEIAPLPQQPLPPQQVVAPRSPPTEAAAPSAAVAPRTPARIDDDDLPVGAATARPKSVAAAARGVAAPVAAPVHRAHPSVARPERRHAAGAKAASDDGQKLGKGESPDEAPAPLKPTKQKRPIEDDPDATMAPTIE